MARRISSKRENKNNRNINRNADRNNRKQRETRENKVSTGSMRDFRNMSIIISAILYFFIRFTVLNKSGIVGSAYFSGIFNIVILIMMTVPVAFTEIVSKHVREQIDIMSYKNAKRLLFFSLFLGIVFNIILAIIFNVVENSLCVNFAGDNKASYTLSIFIPYVFVITAIAIFKGFFMGTKLKRELYLSEVVEKVSVFLSVMIFSGITNNSGTKAVAIFQNSKVLEAYHSGGVAIGMLIGAILTLIFCIVIYVLNSSNMSLMDETRRTLDVYDLASKLILEVLVIGVSTCFIFLVPVINQYIYNKNTESSSSLALYNFTGYFGVFMAVCAVAVYFGYVYSFLERKVVYSNFYGGDKHEATYRVGKSISHIFKYLIPYCLVIFVLADVICKGLVGYESALYAAIIRKGIFALIFLIPGIVFMNCLIAVEKYLLAIISGVAGLIVNIIVAIMSLGALNMGVNGLVLSLYAFAGTYSFVGLIIVCNIFEFNPDIIKQTILGIIGGIGGALAAFLITLLFNLFAPAIITFIVAFIFAVLATYFIYVKFNIVSYNSVAKSPAAVILVPIGNFFGLSSNERRSR